jgi:hypothetical protein
MDGNQSLDKCDPLLPPRLPIGVTLSKNALKPFSSFQFLIGGLGGGQRKNSLAGATLCG